MLIDRAFQAFNDWSDSTSEQWVTARRAAEYSGYSAEYIRRIARDGIIQAKSEGPGKPSLYLLQTLLAYREQKEAEAHVYPPVPKSTERSNYDLPTVLTAAGPASVTTQGAAMPALPRVLPARFVLTDQMSIILSCVTPEHSIFTAFSEIRLDAVRELVSAPELRDQRLTPYFSTEQSAQLICNHLRLNLKHNARNPQLSAGDNIIIAEVKSGGIRPAIRYILGRIAI